MKSWYVVLVVALAAGCGPGKPDSADTSVAGATTGAMAGHDMSGAGSMQSSAMMDSMAVHMRGMETATGADLQAMVPMHRQMAANLLSQINTEMRGMNMAPDARFTAVMDSVRQDLARLPDVPASQLKTFMTSHHARLQRLMQAHKDMMGTMKKP